MTLIDALLKDAETGRAVIDACVPDNGRNNVIVIFPKENAELFHTACQYFDRFLSDYDYGVVVTSADVSELARYTKRPFGMKRINDIEMQCVLRYASMVHLDSIKIISLRQPHCKKAEILEGFKDITLDKMVCRNLYGIWGAV